MPDTVIVTTQDLGPAVRLRDAFVAEDYAVELLTAGERIADVENPVLLILTGALDEKQARRLSREALEYSHLPIIGLFEAAKDATPEARRRLNLNESFVKPIDPQEVALIGHRLIQRRHVREVTGIIGEADAMAEVLERVVQIAPVNSTVLVTGESGTGKERIARGIHALSPRRHRPFIAANVVALPETLLESELFGHEKGSFTGAIGQRKGFFELANKGTLFLDEIGEMPLSTQTKLLRVLEEREFMRVGGEDSITVDVRFIAATNQELRQLVDLGRFRRDLYYRLNVLRIELPPLRERREDIPILIEHFIRESSAEHDRLRVTVSPDALRLLSEYSWPGNVRELKNLVESMVVLAPGTVVRPADIPREIRDRAGKAALPVPLFRSDADGAAATPELEFIFRTLIQLRMDVDDLRGRFDEYRDTHPELIRPIPYALPGHAGPQHLGEILPPEPEAEAIVEGTGDGIDEGVVVYRPGMTLRDIEQAVITAALTEVRGNRRRAAEILGMGERTLYRKIKEYEIPL